MHGVWGRWWVLLAIPALMLAWVAHGNIQEDALTRDAPFRALHGVEDDAQRESLEALLGESWSILRAPEFGENLRALKARYPAIYANPGRQTATPDDVADLVALKAPGSRYVPADVWIMEGGDGFLGLARENAAGEGRYSDIVLVRPVMRAWVAPDVVMRSCAINVAAHEYSHTISTTPFVYRTAFTDTSLDEREIRGRRDRSTPVASYLLGAVAQCTWLQKQGRIGRLDVPGCVEVFGTAAGNPERCASFAGGQPIAPRPDLPDANPAL